MDDILKEERFDYISEDDKAFITAFNNEMTRLGYGYGGEIGSGYCWGKHMIIYTKTGVKSKAVFARIYMREPRIALRLFLNNVDKHRVFIEHAPAYIKEIFVGQHGDCQHCHNAGEDGKCRFRKTYTIDGRLIEKCNGITFEFYDPSVKKLKDYIDLFTEFYPAKRTERKQKM